MNPQKSRRKALIFYAIHKKIFGMPELKLEQLRAFADVAELGTFSAAAARRHLTQPAVSLQVRHLEKHLGVRLIERTGKRAAPTAAGREVLLHAQHIDSAVAALFAGMTRHGGGVLTRVRLGTGATACTYLLPSVLRDLRREQPALEISVITGNSDDVLKSIEENRLDVGLVTLPARGRAFDVQPLWEDEIVAVARRDSHALPTKVTSSTLNHVALLLYEPGGNTRRLIDRWFRRGGLRPTPAMELGSVEAIKRLVAAGLGCGLVPRLALTRADRRSLAVRELSPRLTRTLAVVVRRDKVRHQALRRTIAALKTAAQAV
jgi:DNA-binding transcriptional LysR family regulator